MRGVPLFAAAALSALAGCASPEPLDDTPPVASAGHDLRVVLSGGVVYVRLDGSDSYDEEGAPLTYEWALVRSPSPVLLNPADGASPRPTLALEAPGLHVLSLVVEDGVLRSAPDFVNVWVVDARDEAEPDVGPPPDGGELDDAGPAAERDAGPDAELDLGPTPFDAGLDAGVGAADGGENEVDGESSAEDAAPVRGPPDADDTADDSGEPLDPDPPAPEIGPIPVPIIDTSADRVRIGTSVRLSAARTRDDGGPRPLAYRWSLRSAPFGARATFADEGVVIEYTPRRAGRYTFRLEVDDGEHVVQAVHAVHAIGPVGYVLDSARDAVWRFDLGNGTALDEAPIELGAAPEPAGFAVRAGVIYVTAVHGDDRPGQLLVKAPAAPTIRRLLPADFAPAAPVPAVDGVWVPMQGAPHLFFSDPLGRAPLGHLRLPDQWSRGLGMAVDGDHAWLANTSNPAALLQLDLRRARLVGVTFRDEGVCRAHSVALDDDFVYVGCRSRNRIARVRRGHRGEIANEHTIPLQGAQARQRAMTASEGVLAVAHLDADYVSLLPVERFELPPAHEDRERQRQLVLPVEGQVSDLVARGRELFVLSQHPEGGVVITAFDLHTRARAWRRHLRARTGRHLAVDAADDLSREFGTL